MNITEEKPQVRKFSLHVTEAELKLIRAALGSFHPSSGADMPAVYDMYNKTGYALGK